MRRTRQRRDSGRWCWGRAALTPRTPRTRHLRRAATRDSLAQLHPQRQPTSLSPARSFSRAASRRFAAAEVVSPRNHSLQVAWRHPRALDSPRGSRPDRAVEGRSRRRRCRRGNGLSRLSRGRCSRGNPELSAATTRDVGRTYALGNSPCWSTWRSRRGVEQASRTL